MCVAWVPFQNFISINFASIFSLSIATLWITNTFYSCPCMHMNSFFVSIVPSSIPNSHSTYFRHYFYNDIFMFAPVMHPILFVRTELVTLVKILRLTFHNTFLALTLALLCYVVFVFLRKFVFFYHVFLLLQISTSNFLGLQNHLFLPFHLHQ